MKNTAVVTGSTSGIGLAIARALAAQGLDILLHGLAEPAEADALCRALAGEFGVRVHHDGSDLARPGGAEALMHAALERFGSVQVLVNNAGIQRVAPVDELPPADWDRILAVNLTAAFHTVRLALPNMKRARWGRIVNVASAHALVASPYKAAYVASKHAIAGFTKAVALEVAELGITVNAVCPGYVRTPLVDAQIPETAKARGISEQAVVRDVLLHAQPTRRFVAAEEVGALTAFLCGPAAASITGAVLPVDGGWTAQ